MGVRGRKVSSTGFEISGEGCFAAADLASARGLLFEDFDR